MTRARIENFFWAAVSVSIALVAADAAAQNARPIDPDKARVVEYWTKERRAKAIPRDLVIDPRGLGYLRRPDGTLVPNGHDVEAQTPARRPTPSPFARPGGSNDGTPPTISDMDPRDWKVIGSTYTFSAQVTDASGVKSVTFKIRKVGATFVNSFSASKVADSDIWSATVQGFSNGDWSWWVEAKDNAGRGGNSGTSGTEFFTVSAGGDTGGNSDTVTDANWSGGAVQKAAGRIYFEMPNNPKRKGQWTGYVCSGTVANDENANGVDTAGRSVIITAAHCVYDDVNKAFARNVLFIPNQAGTSGPGTDRNCGNDPIGCWVPSFGVVDVNWTAGTFPNNIEWDYAYYVVSDFGAHLQGLTSAPDILDSATAAGSLTVSFGTVWYDDGSPGKSSSDFTHALGYSYSQDPKFRYCAEDMTTEGTVNWWLPSCGLTGGSSGGPWVQKMDLATGSGPIISVNSWGYTDRPGMAGPKLVGTSAECVFGVAKSEPLPSNKPADGNAGTAVSCP